MEVINEPEHLQVRQEHYKPVKFVEHGLFKCTAEGNVNGHTAAMTLRSSELFIVQHCGTRAAP